MSTMTASTDRPNKTWTLAALETYARARAGDINSFGRQTLEQTWLFGEAFNFIREIKKEKGQWMKWVETQRFSLSTATNSIKVFERVSFNELKKFDGMTASDMKAALEIIKTPPPKNRKENEARPTPDTSEKAIDQTTENAPEKTDRHVTTTDYSRNGDQKTSEAVVGPALTASEVLGKAYSLLITAEQVGITQECKNILTQLSEKIAALASTMVA